MNIKEYLQFDYTEDEATAFEVGYDAGLHADRWHYPSKGEYPTEGEDVVALVKAGKKMLKGIGVYINQEWAIRHREEMWLIEPYAWQCIVPPKERT